MRSVESRPMMKRSVAWVRVYSIRLRHEPSIAPIVPICVFLVSVAPLAS